MKGNLSIAEASILLGLSERQIKRLRKGVQEKGADAVKHGNKGKPPSTTLTMELKNRILTKTVSLRYTKENIPGQTSNILLS